MRLDEANERFNEIAGIRFRRPFYFEGFKLNYCK